MEGGLCMDGWQCKSIIQKAESYRALIPKEKSFLNLLTDYKHV